MHINIGSRLELFVDRYLVDSLAGLDFKLHTPQLAPPAIHPIRSHYLTEYLKGRPYDKMAVDHYARGVHYLTVLLDGQCYRAYYRQYDPSHRDKIDEGCTAELTCCAESRDGSEWSLPDLGLYEVNGSRHNNVVLREGPFSHNFSPVLDANLQAPAATRYKALAGLAPIKHIPRTDGLYAFQSPDGYHWKLMHDGPVITHKELAFDSQNVSFWSAAENCYVCYFRTWKAANEKVRTISRTTSPDYRHWSEAVCLEPNLPGEHFYTSQTQPYFRAPHIYIALPTRFLPKRGSSTDILFMTTRAGTTCYDRLFTEAFIRPGLDPDRWGNRSNYAACGVVPTGPAEMSIYHIAGQRYTLRTDGFISIHAGYASGQMTTKPFIFTGANLTLNLATSAAGNLRVELQDEQGRPLPGRTLTDSDNLFGDAIERTVTWKGDAAVGNWAGQPVRLRFEMNEADLYSLRFA